MRREGTKVARCRVERLMRQLGLRGVVRGARCRTTMASARAPCPLDRVKPVFSAERPNQLWIADFTYVATWSGFVMLQCRYIAFVSSRNCAEQHWLPLPERAIAPAGLPLRNNAICIASYSRYATLCHPFTPLDTPRTGQGPRVSLQIHRTGLTPGSPSQSPRLPG